MKELYIIIKEIKIHLQIFKTIKSIFNNLNKKFVSLILKHNNI